jgi:hypothetical protein
MDDFLNILFPDHANTTAADVEAGLAAMRDADAARLAALAERNAARDAERIANRCPKCAGAGYLSQFAHHKGGECFTCGGTGVFSKYAA